MTFRVPSDLETPVCTAIAALMMGCGSPGAAPPKTKAPTTDHQEAGELTRVEPRGDLSRAMVELPLRKGIAEATVLDEGLVRLRFKRDAAARILPSFSIDPAFKPALPAFELSQTEAKTTIGTAQMSLVFDHSEQFVEQRDEEGNLVTRFELSNLWSDEKARGPRISWSLEDGERVYGLGDKAKGHDRRGHSFEMWNTDAFGWEVDQDPLYKTFPVFVMMDEGRAHGVFVDSPTRSEVDVGHVDSERVQYSLAQGESVDVYLFVASDPKEVISGYTELTGRMPLPPVWSLGFHMSRYGYLSEKEVRGVVDRFDQADIPLDVIWLDIDFQQKNAPFSVDRQAFPTFKQMVRDFADDGVKTVCITDLHIKSHQGKESPSGYVPYDSGALGDHFLRAPGGESFFVGRVWPGESVFPEYTLSRTRKWWGGLYRDFLDDGIVGFWNDMNEPVLFDAESKTMPEDQLHRLDDGSSVEHQVIHNAYGALNVRATFEGVSQLRPHDRAFTLTRAAFSGAQRYSASWTGDNTANREHLAATIPNLTNLGVSGYPYVGADVGGFDGCPDPELLVEWMELGAFQPFYRNHSGKRTCRREPWVHGAEMEARTKRAIERRYRFLPYIYSVFEEASRTGVPMMRPLWLEYPDDATVKDSSHAFFVGADLLVAPKLRAGRGPFSVVLPRAGFFDIMNGVHYPDGGTIEVEPRDGDSLRLFAREGAIIAQAPVVEHSSERPRGPLTLLVFPGEDCRGELYVDDGRSMNYRKGEWGRYSFSCQKSESGWSVSAKRTGSFPVWWDEIEIVLYGASDSDLLRRRFENRGESFEVGIK